MRDKDTLAVFHFPFRFRISVEIFAGQIVGVRIRKTFLQSLSKIVRAVFEGPKKGPFGTLLVMHPLERKYAYIQEED
jgi:hypothetical protein